MADDSISPAYLLRDTRTGESFKIHCQPSNIGACVSLSIPRCIYSIIGILLVLTDIPRTGLAVNLSSYFASVAPGTVMYYGPYAYPLVHLNHSNTTNEVQAFAGDNRVDEVSVWAYKFDSMSIPTRALAEHLNVSSYPRCLLYETRCEAAMMQPSVTFGMLNGLMAAIHGQYFDHSAIRSVPVVFETISYWADRLHHVLLGKSTHRLDHRIHSVQRFAAGSSLNAGERLSIDICDARTATDRHRPMVCNLPVKWMSDHPTLGRSAQIPIQESIRLRFSSLQQRYPHVTLEMMLITTKSPIQSRANAFLPTVHYYSENLEVTTLIRGHHCPSGEPCRVEFIDDYRYERATVETTSHEMKFITGSLRAVAQVYIWLRVVLLVSVCLQSRLAESSVRASSPRRKALAIMLTLLQIPSNTIIYSSWLPVALYAAAHYIDCGLVHLVTDSFWSSTNGFVEFDFINFIIVASIQMRNAWLLALVWKTAFALCPIVFTNRNTPWQPQQGVFAFRAVFIGTISSLTTLSFMPRRRFRFTKVKAFTEVPRYNGPTRLLFPTRSPTTSDFGSFLDLKTILAAAIVVFGASFVLQTLLHAIGEGRTRFFACHNFYVPLSAGKIFPQSALNVFWHIRLIPRSKSSSIALLPRPPSMAPFFGVMSLKAMASVSPLQALPRLRQCDVCNFIPAPLYWQATQGCTRHEPIFSIGDRSVAMQSMVRLVNIGMLSDPVVFLRLRLFGRPLNLHRTQSKDARPRLEMSEGGTQCAAADASYVLTPATSNTSASISSSHSSSHAVAAIDSRFVPWTVLVDCG